MLGIVMVFNTKDPTTVGTVQCRLAWSREPTSGWSWLAGADGLTGPELIPIDGAGSGAFDSNICFAAKPVVGPDGDIWPYYMGGDGAHNGFRNSSLGLATLRPDGFAGIRADAEELSTTTVPLLVEGATLIITADVLAPTG